MKDSRRSLRQRGVSLIEFTIVFPLAVLFVMALVQLGFLYMARSTLNHATFMAARQGSLHNADSGVIKEALVRGLLPFYQDNTIAADLERLTKARLRYTLDAATHPWLLKIDRLSPSAETFQDFGVKDPVTKVTYIPNDNLEWRNDAVIGPRSKQNIRDANLLKLHVVYAYEPKVPLIAGVIKRVMCGGSDGVEAWGDVSVVQAVDPFGDNCTRYYRFGRIPIESWAIVEMQTRAEQP